MTNIRLFVLLLLSALILMEHPLRAQQQSVQAVQRTSVMRLPGVPTIRNYAPARYQAHGQNFGVAQDRRGLVYFANTSGVLEHDGATWRTIPTSGNSIVRSVVCDSTGRIYVGARGDFGYLVPDSTGATTFISLLNKVEKKDQDFLDVWRVYANRDGIWFITNSSVFHWHKNKITAIPANKEILASYSVGGRIILQERNFELFEIVNDQFRKLPSADITAKSMEVVALLPVNAAQALLVTANNGLYYYDYQRLTPFQTEASALIQANRLSEAAFLSDGSLALGTTRNGAIILGRSGNLLTVINKAAGMQDENVKFLYTDRQAGLWLALNNGISRVELPSPLTFMTESKAPQGGVTDCKRHDGMLYFATYDGLYTLNEVTGGYTPVSGIVTTCWSIMPTPKGLLAATSEGVYLVDKQAARKLTQGFSFSLCTSKLHQNTVYAGEKNSISVLTLGAAGWTSSGAIPCPYNEIHEIVEDRDGWLWIPTIAKGILRFRAPASGTERPEILRYDTTHKLPSMLGNHATLLNGQAMMVTPEGIMKLNAAKNIFEKDPRLDSTLREGWYSRVFEDDNGNIWTTSGNGKNLSLHRASPDGHYRLEKTPFLPIAEMTVWAILPGKDVLWLGGPDGVVRYDQSVAKDYKVPFPALIRQVTINSDSIAFEGNYFDVNGIPSLEQNPEFQLVLPYDKNTLRFEYVGANYDNSPANLYQIKLEGFDQNWSDWLRDLQKEYTNLPDGKYTFRVRCKNIYGAVSSEATYTFEILKPWFKTWWAYVGYFLLSTGTVWLLVRWRLQQAEKEKRELERVIEERTSEVVHQKEEIEIASAELANKNDELEKINAIVKSINAQINFSEMLQSILEKTKRIIRGVQQAELLVLSADSGEYEAKAQLGWDEPREEHLTLQEVEEIYLHNTQEVYQDIYTAVAGDGKEINHSRAVMVVKVQDKVEGFLIIENTRKTNAFDDRDFSLLRNLKEHITSAFIKTKILGDLQVKNNLVEAYVKTIKRDLDTASKIQHAILPDANNPFPQIKEFGICAEMIAAKDVGGDFYDFFLIDKDRLGFVMADVSGKGMPAALFMAVSRTMLKSTALLGGKPGDVLEIVNDLLAAENVSTLFVTVFYGILSIRTGEVEYANGGHNLPFILRKNGAVEMMKKTGGMGLAIMEEMPFENAKLQLEKGDAMFLYTDGVTEAMDIHDNLYTDPRLEETLKKLNKNAGISDIMNGVITDVKKFATGAPQADDITVLTLRYEG
jgi:serine phosphatase RsbU (regulator of sigma subunit)/ligand-binding sensor domain-containing protein